MTSLRSKVIRLAAENASLRPLLLPLLKTANVRVVVNADYDRGVATFRWIGPGLDGRMAVHNVRVPFQVILSWKDAPHSRVVPLPQRAGGEGFRIFLNEILHELEDRFLDEKDGVRFLTQTHGDFSLGNAAGTLLLTYQQQAS